MRGTPGTAKMPGMAKFRLSDTHRAQIAENYFSRWDKDDLSDIIVMNSAEEQPLRNFRGFVMAMWEVEQNWQEDPRFAAPAKPPQLDLERTTFREFLKRRVWLVGQTLSIEEAAFNSLCIPTTRNSVWDALTSGDDRTDNIDGLRAGLADGSLLADLAPILWTETVKRYGARALLSWFIVQRNSSGWLRYFERSFSTNDDPLRLGVEARDQRRKILKTEAGDVELRVNRLHRDADDVNAYEWEARLLSRLGVLQAVANGSLFIRKRGDPFIDLDRLFYTADECSDHDAAMVYELDKDGGPMAFEYPAGDLLFVWNWERLPHAPAGSGASCLIAALDSLRRSYRGLLELVFDARPAQFASWPEGREHPQVGTARGEAVARVGDLIEEVVLSCRDEYELTMIYPTLDEHPLGVVREIGRRGVQALTVGGRQWRGISDLSDLMR